MGKNPSKTLPPAAQSGPLPVSREPNAVTDNPEPEMKQPDAAGDVVNDVAPQEPPNALAARPDAPQPAVNPEPVPVAVGSDYAPGLEGTLSASKIAEEEQVAQEQMGDPAPTYGETMTAFSLPSDELPEALRHLQARTDPPTAPLSASKAVRKFLARYEAASKAAGNEEQKQFAHDAAAIIRWQAGISPDEVLYATDPPTPYGPIDTSQKRISNHDHAYYPYAPPAPATSAIEEAQKIDAVRGTALASTSNTSN